MESNWSLEALYKGLDDEKFSSDFAQMEKDFEERVAFARENFSGGTENAASKLENYINMCNSQNSRASKLLHFVQLILSVNSEDSAAQKMFDKLDDMLTTLTVPDTLYKAFLAKLDDLDFSTVPVLHEHRFHLQKSKEKASYMLSEQEEFIYEKLKLTGSNAWETLYSQLTSTLNVPITLDGEDKVLPLPAIRNLANHKNADVRKTAYDAELASYAQIEKSIAACLNGIKGETITNFKLRGYESVLDMTCKNDHMDKETLEALLETMQEYFPVFRKYFKHKAKLLGHKGSLPFYDLFAPVGELDMVFTQQEAADYVVKNFNAFSDELGNFARHAFDNGWVDWIPKEGKLGGAFCDNIHAIKQSRILTNFSGSFDCMITLAHELGHAYHGFCLDNVSYLNSHYTMPIAEVASTFCETLVCEAAIKSASPAEKLVILENNLQGASQVIVDIYSRFLFEDEVIKRRENGSLSVTELKDIMLNAQKVAYGDGLEATALHPYMWLCKSHYYYASQHYYNYPYAFGLLFAKGLYSMYQQEGSAFTQKYSALLTATGSNTLYDTGKIIGIDIRDKAFWRSSLDIVASQVEEFVKY